MALYEDIKLNLVVILTSSLGNISMIREYYINDIREYREHKTSWNKKLSLKRYKILIIDVEIVEMGGRIICNRSRACRGVLRF